MICVFWTYLDARGVMLDAYEVIESENAAHARCNQLAERAGVYAWGMAPISRASEPHWEKGWMK